MAVPRLAIICSVMHLFLIFAYVTLLVIVSSHYEHRLNYTLTPIRQTVMTAVVNVVPQTFGIIYLAILVLVTQRLALCRDVHTQQTLTAIHDKSSAWLGLGSSLFSLFAQFKMPAATLTVTLITLYLGGIAVLHIIIPASFSVNTYNGTAITRQTTQLARPYFHDFSEDTVSGWNILRIYNQLPQVGLKDNMIYDIIPADPKAVNDVMVNATSFEVDCGLVPSAHQTDFDWDGFHDRGEAEWTLNVTSGIVIDIDNPSPLILKTWFSWEFLELADDSDPQLPASVIPLISSIPVIDAAGNHATTVPIEPAFLAPVTINDETRNLSVTSVSAILCNVNARNHTTRVDALTRQPSHGNATTAAATWKNWMAPPDPTDPLIQSVDFSTSPRAVDEQSTPKWFTDYFKPVQAFVYNTTNSPLLPETALKQVAPSFALPILSVVDQFLMEDLMTEAGIWPPSSRTVLLSDLQLSLGKIFAAMVWYYRNGNHSSAYSYNPDWIANQDRVGEAEITIAVLRLRLNFNTTLLAIGLGISCLLFALAFFIPAWRQSEQEVVDDVNVAGILQLAWLFGDDVHFVGVQKPDNQILRRTGLFDVQLSVVAEEKATAAVQGLKLQSSLHDMKNPEK